MMPEFNPLPPDDSNGPEKANRCEGGRSEGARCEGTRFDGAASVPRSHTSPASHFWEAIGGLQETHDSRPSESVRDVSIEALLYRLDEALAAIRSLDEIPADEGGAGDGKEDLESPRPAD